MQICCGRIGRLSNTLLALVGLAAGGSGATYAGGGGMFSWFSQLSSSLSMSDCLSSNATHSCLYASTRSLHTNFVVTLQLAVTCREPKVF